MSVCRCCCHPRKDRYLCSSSWAPSRLRWCTTWRGSVLRADLGEHRCIEVSKKMRFQSGYWLWKFGETEDVGEPFRGQSIIFEPLLYCDVVHPAICFFQVYREEKKSLAFLALEVIHSWSREDFPAMNPNRRFEMKSFSLIHWIILRKKRRSRISSMQF